MSTPHFFLSFDMGNDAFSGAPVDEASRAVAQVLSDVSIGKSNGPVYDLNGNKIGSYSVIDEDGKAMNWFDVYKYHGGTDHE